MEERFSHNSLIHIYVRVANFTIKALFLRFKLVNFNMNEFPNKEDEKNTHVERAALFSVELSVHFQTSYSEQFS